ncbi:PKD domain-containing protein [Methanogenium cariaci]|uniref:PKD domain-containing protein n=1 Tax=Methanogenium cariaci TaxID=2197 RepID=UPI00078555A9|nr:PKD domain-containing protein [Methanogenium cariaci]
MPFTVDFTDMSTGEPTSWEWDFDGDGNIDSTEQNPSWTYTQAGTYPVSLSVENPIGTDTCTQADFIRPKPRRSGMWMMTVRSTRTGTMQQLRKQ